MPGDGIGAKLVNSMVLLAAVALPATRQARALCPRLDSLEHLGLHDQCALRIKLYTALKDQVAAERLKEAVDNLLKMHRTVM